MNRGCLMVLITFSCAFCHPTKPLNERSTELAWEAWLLVDQTNRQSDLGMLRRRITPKSVFIAPTFSPDSLPACAEGYKSDIMGRCVKIIKINESAHFDFLLHKLNEQFPDYEEATESSTHGPLQLNIPLFDVEDQLSENETEIAIVVTPSTKRKHETTTVHVEMKRNGDRFNVEDVAAILGVKPEEVEMTTIAQLSTTVAMSTTTEEVTTLQTSTVGATETVVPTEAMSTTENPETTTVEGEALFFQVRL